MFEILILLSSKLHMYLKDCSRTLNRPVPIRVPQNSQNRDQEFLPDSDERLNARIGSSGPPPRNLTVDRKLHFLCLVVACWRRHVLFEFVAIFISVKRFNVKVSSKIFRSQRILTNHVWMNFLQLKTFLLS